jgi:hypothetical protein
MPSTHVSLETGFALPHDLLVSVLANAQSPTLAACALVCRSWSDTSQRLLFSVVKLGVRKADATRFGKALRKNRRLEQLVRSLTCLGDVALFAFNTQMWNDFTALARLDLRDMSISEEALNFILHVPALRTLVIDQWFIVNRPHYDRILATTSAHVFLEGLELRGAWEQNMAPRGELSTMVARIGFRHLRHLLVDIVDDADWGLVRELLAGNRQLSKLCLNLSWSWNREPHIGVIQLCFVRKYRRLTRICSRQGLGITEC